MLIKASQSQENRDIIEYLGLQAGELPTTVPISMYNIRYDALVPKHDMAMLCADPIIVNALDA